MTLKLKNKFLLLINLDNIKQDTSLKTTLGQSGIPFQKFSDELTKKTENVLNFPFFVSLLIYEDKSFRIALKNYYYIYFFKQYLLFKNTNEKTINYTDFFCILRTFLECNSISLKREEFFSRKMDKKIIKSFIGRLKSIQFKINK
jgi:ribosomal protein L11